MDLLNPRFVRAVEPKINVWSSYSQKGPAMTWSEPRFLRLRPQCFNDSYPAFIATYLAYKSTFSVRFKSHLSTCLLLPGKGECRTAHVSG